MHWIILGVLALALVAISVRYPRLAFAILVVLLGSAILLVQMIPGERERQSARISPADVDVLTLEFIPSYADSFDLIGRLANRSVDTVLSETTLAVELRDCSTESDRDTRNCPGLGVTHPTVTLEVPPGHARDFRVNLSFPRITAQGTAEWKTTVSEVRGHRYQPEDRQ